MPRAPHAGDWISLFALTALWGTAFLMNEVALASFAPSVLVAGRIIIAAAVVVGYLRITGDSLPPPGRAWWPMVVLALFGNVLPFHLVAWSQQHIDSSLAGVLMAVMPLFVLTLAHFFVPGARLTPYRAVGFVIGFTGVVVIIGPDFANGFDGNVAFWGAIAVLGAALSYSISTIYARRLGAGDPVRRSAGMLIVASLMSLPAAAVDIPGINTPSIGSAVALGILGLLATGFATLLYFRLVQGPGPTFLSLVNYVVPAWAVVAGAVFLDESLSLSVFLGMALILCGIALSEIGPRIGRAAQAVRARSLSSLPRVAREDA
ncbi:MAG: DMT family transporter [Gammaproteobacteria bacterium]